ncbi:3-phosphoshikimate 1-carboxyvinyltransferase [Nafulsella turpanensis]|uniref:3-phosphoshikimate 1-carboxyvinyltransferase n=1 Tax=Nafulsella turpanensis TaxID=1265690 RepID=UPI000349424E|nr:3-phosphoshikimate 1-carboxyvinyltransferase [Nafulsella turpanensis]
MFTPIVRINLQKNIRPAAISLPASKSESNRALIIAALCPGGAELHNISEARDTQTMQRLLQSDERVMDVLDAGTTMRFLTAFFAVNGQEKIMTGTERMQQRPIGLLVDALRLLGAQVDYTAREGYPPLHISGPFEQKIKRLSIRGDVSSQYISALLMIAPALSQGLELQLERKIGSRPYIDMTLQLMTRFGIEAEWNGNIIRVKPGQSYKTESYTIESDWSGASYWLSFTALAEEAEISLLGLRPDSLQGDIRILEIMEKAGVGYRWEGSMLHLFKKEAAGEISVDFTHCPDLAQTVAVACAAKGIKGYFTGLESLRIKETDRIAALQTELAKINARLIEAEEGKWELHPTDKMPEGAIRIHTYDDHRMAMAFAPLATQLPLVIEEPDVVRKSYPRFWQNMEEAGFSLQVEG